MSNTLRTFFGFHRNIQIKNRIKGEYSSLDKIKELNSCSIRKLNRLNRHISFFDTKKPFIAARFENKHYY